MVSIMTFCQFVQPKIALITLEKLISAKMSGQNSEIKENFPVGIFSSWTVKLTFVIFGRFK